MTCQGGPSALVTVIAFDRLARRRSRTALPDLIAELASSRNLSQNHLPCKFTAQHHHLPVPGYTYTTAGPGNEPTFTATATLSQHTAQGAGPTKTTAKTCAAAALLAQLTTEHGETSVIAAR